jgi:drug/metabolite transporter (DMT)-like permease
MKMSKRRVSKKFATWIVLVMAIAVTAAITLAFPPLSFAWLAWGALGYFAIVTGWREFIVVNRGAEGASPDCQISTTLAIYAGSLVASAVSVLGFLELIQMRDALTGLAAIVMLDCLLRQTIADR